MAASEGEAAIGSARSEPYRPQAPSIVTVFSTVNVVYTSPGVSTPPGSNPPPRHCWRSRPCTPCGFHHDPIRRRKRDCVVCRMKICNAHIRVNIISICRSTSLKPFARSAPVKMLSSGSLMTESTVSGWYARRLASR